MVKEVLFIGNSDELAAQFEAYARHGLEHVVLANITGVVGGMDGRMARGMELPVLKNVLSEL
jgi:phthiodiolone/phenolphthiodiolone dimycocerosates ketoreductase